MLKKILWQKRADELLDIILCDDCIKEKDKIYREGEGSAQVKQILYGDGPVSTSRVVKDYEEIATEIPVKTS